MNARNTAAFAALALIWGLSFLVLVRVNLAFGWAGAVAFRCLIAGTAVFAASLLTGKKLRFNAPRRHFIVIGLTTVAGQLAGFTCATPRIGTAMAAVFAAIIPLLSMLIGWLWKLETTTPKKLGGLCLGVTGIILLVGFPAAEPTPTFFLGCAFAMLGATSAAFGSNYASRYLSGEGAMETTIASFLWGGAIMLPLVLFFPVPGVPSVESFAWLLVLGAVMSGVAYLLYFMLVANIGATKTISVEFLVTVIAVFVGTCLLGESLTLMQVLGGGVIILGCALVLDFRLSGAKPKSGT